MGSKGDDRGFDSVPIRGGRAKFLSSLSPPTVPPTGFKRKKRLDIRNPAFWEECRQWAESHLGGSSDRLNAAADKALEVVELYELDQLQVQLWIRYGAALYDYEYALGRRAEGGRPTRSNRRAPGVTSVQQSNRTAVQATNLVRRFPH